MQIRGNLQVLRELKALWMKFSSGNESELLNVQVDPSQTALDAPKGSIAIREDVPGVYQKLDDGETTNWRKLSDLVIFNDETAAQAANSSNGHLAFILSNNTFYKYVTDSSLIANGEQILTTGDAGDTRWYAVAGYKAIPEALQQYASTIKATGFDKSGSANISSISFNASTRIFTLDPISTEIIWRNGERNTIEDILTVELANAEGLHYVYFGKSIPADDNELRTTQNFTDEMRKTEALVASIYFDASNGKALVRDERHTAGIPSDSRLFEHQNRGSIIQTGTGKLTPVVGDGTLQSHAEIAMEELTLVDEDIRRVIAAATPLQVSFAYKAGSAIRWDDATTILAKRSGGQAQYNNGTAQAAIDNGKFFCTHLVAVGSEDKKVIAIQGRGVYNSANDAFEGAYPEIVAALSDMKDFLEDAVVLGSVILEANTSFQVGCRVVKNWMGDDHIDWSSNNFNVINQAKAGPLGGGESEISQTVKANVRSITKISASTTLNFDDHDVIWVTATGDITITLPGLLSEYEGTFFTIKRTQTTGDLTIATADTATIDGENTVSMPSGNKNSITVQTDGENWMII